MSDKYQIDGHKLLWHLDRVSAWQKDRCIAPIYIEISPVSFCNHNCVFCGIDFARIHQHSLPTALLKNRLSEMASLGVKSIMLAGEGEPFLHKDLPEIVQHARQTGLDVSITTNGAAKDRQYMASVLPSLTWIRFSVDAGSADVYAAIHNVSTAMFSKTVKTITEAVELKKELNLATTIGVQFLIMEENLADIEAAIQIFSQAGVDYLSFKSFSLHPKMIQKRSVLYSDETIETLHALVDLYQPKTAMQIIFREDSLRTYIKNQTAFEHCYAQPFWGYLASDGQFYSCSVFLNEEKFQVGNVLSEPMESIFFGEKRKKALEFAEKQLCIVEDCRINCRMARINEFLSALQSPPEHINFI